MIKISTRLVFVFKNFVIKIPLSKRGYLQGLNEKKIWDKYKHFELLAPLKWEFFGIICQEKCIDIGSDCWSSFHVKLIKRIITEFDFDNCDLYKRQNWGVFGGKIVLLDYGINERISKMY